jgi:hypothetical protein
LADGPASNAFIASDAVAVLLGTVRRTGTRVGSLTTSPPLPSRRRKYARIVEVGAGVGDGDGEATVGLGVTGTGVTDGVGATVGAGSVADVVGDGKLGVGEPESVGFGLAAGEPQAATRARIRSATTDRLRSIRGPPRGDSSNLRIDARPRADICRLSRSQRPSGLSSACA